jgi:pre-60S factor REI1
MRSAPSRNEESEQHDWQSESSSDEWEEVNHDEIMSLDSFGVNGYNGNEPDWDVNQCFFCNIVPDGSMEGCVEHMHKQHGFFIPDADYLNDPKGLLTYLGLKVTAAYLNNEIAFLIHRKVLIYEADPVL